MSPKESSKATSQKPNQLPKKPKEADGKAEVTEAGSKRKNVEISARTGKPKRRKAFRACTNCQRTHLTCDDDRPCERCVKRGCADTCMDGERKPPKKGISKSTIGKSSSDMFHFVPDVFGNHSQTPPHCTIPRQFPQYHHQNSSHIHNETGTIPPSIPNHQADPDPSMHANHDLISESQVLHQPSPHIIALPASCDKNEVANRLTADKSSISNDGKSSDMPQVSGEAGNVVDPPSLEPFAFANYFDPHAFDWGSHATMNSRTNDESPSLIHNREDSVISAMLQNRSDELKDVLTDGQLRTHIEGDSYDSANQRNDIYPVDDSTHYPDIPSWMDTSVNGNGNHVSSRRFSSILDHTDPSEVYRKVTIPYPNRKAFNQMISYLKRRLQTKEFKQLEGKISKLKSRFAGITKPLSHEDKLFIEQSFQRSLLEEEKQFALIPMPCLVWRRSGVIASVSPRFMALTQWSLEHLRSGFIMQVMNNESIHRYFSEYHSAIFNNRLEFKFECTLMTSSGEQVPTEAEVSIRKDLFSLPLTFVGKFWVKS